ncbi:MAG: phosphatase PAP2 family protein [Candidatus Solibacter usitatus]|nr:phosphatase PAP2 family protein [Candidatus Solibacter usitatus]
MPWPILTGLLLLSMPNHIAGLSEFQPAPSPRPASFSDSIANIASAQTRIWRFPAAMARGRHWKAVAAVTATTAALVALDPVTGPYFRRTSDFRRFNAIFSGSNTTLAIAALPASFYVAGLLGKNSYARTTALLAGEAIAGSEILTSVMKNAGHRLRPAAIPPQGDLANTWFRDKGYSMGGAGSFPSGHTIAAFSVATVFAQRYRHHRWVPYVAYGLAGVIGFSRVTLLSHFPSDVFMGAALGYSISRFVVLR